MDSRPNNELHASPTWQFLQNYRGTPSQDSPWTSARARPCANAAGREEETDSEAVASDAVVAAQPVERVTRKSKDGPGTDLGREEGAAEEPHGVTATDSRARTPVEHGPGTDLGHVTVEHSELTSDMP